TSNVTDVTTPSIRTDPQPASDVDEAGSSVAQSVLASVPIGRMVLPDCIRFGPDRSVTGRSAVHHDCPCVWPGTFRSANQAPMAAMWRMGSRTGWLNVNVTAPLPGQTPSAGQGPA